MDERYGAQGGAILRRFLADIRAAERLSDIPLGSGPIKVVASTR